MKSPVLSLGLGFLAGAFTAPIAGLAMSVAYGGGLTGARRLGLQEKATCELIGWALGALMGAYVAAKLRGRLSPSWAVILGVALFVANGIYFMATPMPIPFWVLGAVASIGGSIAGATLGSAANRVEGGA